MKRERPETTTVYLGIEAGGTRTVARAEEAGRRRVVEREFGPANLRLLDDSQLLRHFRVIARAMPAPSALVIGMAGARTEADWKRIQVAAAKTWSNVPCHATNDLETALAAAGTLKKHPGIPRVLVLSGTGSCCYGITVEGKAAKVGGWGHILGDKGSGYEIGLRALKAAVYYHDRDGEWSELGQRVLRALQLNEPNDLIGWVQQAGKDEIAGIALEVFKAWENRDAIATDILVGAAHSLARDAAACARNLQPRGGPVQYVFAGGVLLKQPRFAQMVGRQLKKIWPQAIVSPLKRSGVEGAVELARKKVPANQWRTARPENWPGDPTGKQKAPRAEKSGWGDIRSMAQSPTEQRNPRSMNLDRLPTREAIDLMLSEDGKLPRALRAEREGIARGIELIVRSFKSGGRLFYVGAGTSGRLGVLDASECPPTFRTDPELVQGIIAGGQVALWSAVEGAEDDPDAGARAIQFRGVGRRDTVVGIAASGRTPFVWGALGEAKKRGASTILLCFNPNLVIPQRQRPKLVIAPRIGPEILTGSTRLKSGTATKLVLNMFTTLAMVRTGKVLSNLMIDVKASNVKLRDRATRMVRELTGADYATAQSALLRSGWKVKEACQALRRDRSPLSGP